MEITVAQKKKKLQMIANRNGVSLSTVYRILRGDGSQRNPKFQTVKQELRLLEEHREGIPGAPVMMVTENALSSHALEFYEQMKHLCMERKIELVLTLEKSVKDDLRRRCFAGIITLTPISVPDEIPVVYLNRRSPSGRESSVCVDGMMNWTKMLIHLKRHGAKRVGIFHGVSQRNVQYYLTAGIMSGEVLLNLAGLPSDPELVCPVTLSPETHAEGLKQAADYFCSLKKLPDTLLVNSDFYIPKMSRRFQEHGIRVPEDLLIAGVHSYLQSVPSASHPTAYTLMEEYHEMESCPCICGVHCFHEMTEAALDLLLEKINRADSIPRQVCFSLKIQDYRFEKGEMKNETPK